jgi:hypothetical protein
MHGTSTRMGAGPRRRVPNPAPHVVGEVPLLGPTLHDSDPTPKANRLGEETTTRQPTRPDAALGLDRCMELRLGRVQDQEARTQPRAPRGRGGATPGPDTDPKLNAQWVSLS